MKCPPLLMLCALFPGALFPAMPESHFIETSDKVRLRVVEAGAGRPLLFVPGWTMTAEIWQGQFDSLSTAYRVISFDPRGQGQSSKPGKGYGSPQRASDIHEIISQLGLKKAVLVGWSLGAVDAVYYIQRYKGEGLAAAVLIDNSVDKNYSSGQTGARLLHDLDTQPYESVISEFIPGVFKTAQPPERLAYLKSLSMQTPLHAARESLARATTSKGLVAALETAGIPASYMVTSRFAEEARKIEAVKGCKVSAEIYENSGHALFIDQAGRFKQSLESFIQKLP